MSTNFGALAYSKGRAYFPSPYCGLDFDSLLMNKMWWKLRRVTALVGS